RSAGRRAVPSGFCTDVADEQSFSTWRRTPRPLGLSPALLKRRFTVSDRANRRALRAASQKAQSAGVLCVTAVSKTGFRVNHLYAVKCAMPIRQLPPVVVN